MNQLIEQVKDHIAGYHLDHFWHPSWFVYFALTTIALW